MSSVPKKADKLFFLSLSLSRHGARGMHYYILLRQCGEKYS